VTVPDDDDRPAVIPSAVDPDVECVRADTQSPSGELAQPPGAPVPASASGDTPQLCPDGYVPRRRSRPGYALEGKRIVSQGPPVQNPNPPPAQRASSATDYLTPQPFDAFLDSVASARYHEIRSLPGCDVESAEAFEQMRAYLLDHYRGVTVDASFVESDGQVIDYIPENQHPAVRRTGGAVSAEQPAPQPTPQPYATTAPAFDSPPTQEVSNALPRARDRHGAELRGRYPQGTIPVYRTTLEQLARFRTLAAYSVKDSIGDVAAPAAPAFPKRYATGEQDVACLGGASFVNVWNPFATPSFQSTFSQQWYLAIQGGTLLQTVECGWHVDLARYGNADPHLFVYTTRKNYEDGHSFYNLDGGAYKPVANPYVLPGAPLTSSQTDGAQIAYKMGFYLTANAWWFYFADQPVGYYPLDWFQNGPLTTGAQRIKFGGEVGSSLPLWPPMGSGRHASAGYGKAAYQRAAFVNPVGGGAFFATLSEAGSVTGPCYSIDITNNSTVADWGTYLFFGGPGGQPC
jgi:hypothetical protein